MRRGIILRNDEFAVSRELMILKSNQKWGLV